MPRIYALADACLKKAIGVLNSCLDLTISESMSWLIFLLRSKRISCQAHVDVPLMEKKGIPPKENVTFATPPPGDILFDNNIKSWVLLSFLSSHVTYSPKSSKRMWRIASANEINRTA